MPRTEPKVLEFATRDEWLRGRKEFITASDVAAILGFDAKRTAAHVFLEKRGLTDPEPDDPMKKAGRKLERAVVEWYADENPHLEVTAHQHRIEVHPDIPWLAVSPDATARELEFQNDKRNVEAKTGNNFNKDPEQRYGETGTDMVPRRNIVQAQVQMFVRGMVVTDQPVLIGGRDFRIYYLARSDDFIAHMLRRLEVFHSQLVAGIPPAIDYEHSSALDLVQEINKNIEARTIELEPEYLELARNLIAARAYVTKLKKFEDTVKAKLLGAIGEAEFGRVKGTSVIVHRHGIKKNFAAKPASTRTEIHVKVKGLEDGETTGNSNAVEAGISAAAAIAAVERTAAGREGDEVTG